MLATPNSSTKKLMVRTKQAASGFVCAWPSQSVADVYRIVRDYGFLQLTARRGMPIQVSRRWVAREVNAWNATQERRMFRSAARWSAAQASGSR